MTGIVEYISRQSNQILACKWFVRNHKEILSLQKELAAKFEDFPTNTEPVSYYFG